MEENKLELADNSAIVGFNLDDLYEVRNITDFLAGMVQIRLPVDKYGTRDPHRPQRYFSQIGLMAAGHPFQVEFEILIDGKAPLSLATALQAFDQCAKEAADSKARELESQRMQAMLQGKSVLRPN